MEFKSFKVKIWKINRKVPSSNILQEENAWQSVLYAIGIFTFTRTARTNLMFIQHPHLQARILCLCPCDALFLSCGQSILERLTTENTSALILKPKYYQNLETFLKNRMKWTSWLAALYGSKLLLSTKHGPSFRLYFNLREKKVFQGIVLMLCACIKNL